MELNFREGLAALARAAPAYFFYAVLLVLGGLLVVLEFGLVLIALRLGRIAPFLAAIIVFAVILLGGCLTIMAWRRLFLFRRYVAMLYLYSGAGLDKAQARAGKMFPSYSAWMGWNRRLRRALVGLGRQTKSAPGIGERLAERAFSPAIFTLAFAHGNEPASVGKALALYWLCGQRTRSLAWRWLKFSAIGLVSVFLCLALPSWFFFSSAGAPQVIGIALAAVIAIFLHQAFFTPLALAGVSAFLLAETQGRVPDPLNYEQAESLLADR